MFEISPVGLSLADEAGLLVLANAAYCTLVGHSFDELVGRSSREFTHPDDLAQHAAVEQMMAAVEVGDPGVRLEKRYVRPDGTVRWGWVAVAYVPGPNGEQWTMATVHNTTDRRHTEETRGCPCARPRRRPVRRARGPAGGVPCRATDDRARTSREGGAVVGA